MKAIVITTFLSLTTLCSVALAQPGIRDVSFGNNGFTSIDIGKSSDYARTVIALPDGKVIVAGNRALSTYDINIASVVRCMSDGSLDMSFGTGGTATVSFGSNSFAGGPATVQPDGKVIVTGAYMVGTNDYDVVAARLNTDGTLDKSFGTGGKVRTTFGVLNDFSTSIAVQPDGKIVIGGYSQVGTQAVFSQTGMQCIFALARYNADGTTDNSFGTAGKVTTVIGQSDLIISLDIQQDGKIIAIGGSSNGTQEQIALARYNSDGSLDATFSDDGKITLTVEEGMPTYVAQADVLPDGRMIVVQEFYSNSTYHNVVSRLNVDGSPDSTFGTNGLMYPQTGLLVYSVRGSNNGKIVVAGTKDDTELLLARYNPDGTPDNTFGQNGILTTNPGPGDDIGRTLDLQANGNLIVAVDVSGQKSHGFMLMQWTSKGEIDNSWGGDGKVDIPAGQGNDYLYGTAVQANGRILVAGMSYNGEGHDLSIAGFTSDGSLDSSFGTMGFTTVNKDTGSLTMSTGPMAVQSDGKIIVAGELIVGPVYVIALSRLTKDGVLDATFGNNGSVTTALGHDDDGAYAVALQPDGKIVITGYSLGASQYDGIVVRYLSNGSVDSTFGTDGTVRYALGSEDFGELISVRPDGKIVIAGRTKVGDDYNLVVQQLNPDGSYDKSFGTNGLTIATLSTGDDGAYSIALQKDGKIVLGGFTHPNTTYDAIVLRFNADGKLDPDFGNAGKVIVAMDTERDELIGSLAIQDDGKILTSGYQTDFAGQGMDNSIPILLRLNIDGSVDKSFGNNGMVTTAFDGEYFGMAKLALQPDGNIIAAMPTFLNNQIDFAPMRLLSGSNLGVEEIEATRTDARLYWNALTENWTLDYEYKGQESTSLSLIDMQGKTVLVIQDNAITELGKHSINFTTRDLARGAYILRMSNGTRQTDFKVMN